MNKDIATSKFVYARRRRDRTSRTPEGDDNARSVYVEMASATTLEDRQVNEHLLNAAYKNINRDGKENTTPIWGVQ